MTYGLTLPTGIARHCHAGRGMSLIEMLMALAITGIVAVAISGMMYGVTSGTESVKGLRSIVAKSKAVTARLDHAVISSKRILAVGDDFILVWVDDLNTDSMPSGCELLLVEHEINSQELIAYRWDPAKAGKQEEFRDDNDSRLQYNGSWAGEGNKGGCDPYNSPNHAYTNTASDQNYVETTFDGNAFRIIAPYKFAHGMAHIYLDGQYIGRIVFTCPGLDNAGNKKTCPQELFYYDSFASGTHTLRMQQVVFTGIPNILLDGIYIENSDANWKYSLSDDFTTAMQTLKTHNDCLTETWATGILDFSLEVNHADPKQATVANYSITFQTNRSVTTICSASRIRYP